ncbi:MAG TPA: hypothetical protein VK989_08845 [Polyangia bacterium]|nr:hypothetical protein [Polyangia bacterium]
MSKRWLIVCLLAALVTVDFVEREAHRPLCIEACGAIGQDVERVANGSAGRGSLLDNSITCDCTGPHYLRRYMPWREYCSWMVARIVATAALLAFVAMTRDLWRRRSRR